MLNQIEMAMLRARGYTQEPTYRRLSEREVVATATKPGAVVAALGSSPTDAGRKLVMVATRR